MNKNNSTSNEVIHFFEWTRTEVSDNVKTSLEVVTSNDDGNSETENKHKHYY